ncbi:hypothetical protein Pcinc_026657 [Petrolisthes cinctipes]|uniref:Nuclease HARBI1 n=1 Tax=Petrolisthes cinctipes TaxID=88211 RepID=A0AAE1F6Z6_PETCI|nr:hypothetical protein Pcinc_026657 [Petrolisthes cinctipes]
MAYSGPATLAEVEADLNLSEEEDIADKHWPRLKLQTHAQEYFCTQWDCRPPPQQHSSPIFSVTVPYQTFYHQFYIRIMDFYMDFDFPQDRWLFYQNIQNANGILEEHQRRRRIRRVVSDRMNPFVAMEDQEFIARFRLRKDTMHDLIQEIQDELLVTQDRKGVPIPPHLQVLIAVASMGNGSYQIVQGDCFSVSQTSVSRCVARVSCAIARRRETYVKFP